MAFIGFFILYPIRTDDVNNVCYIEFSVYTILTCKYARAKCLCMYVFCCILLALNTEQ